MNELKSFNEQVLYPRLFNSIDTVLPEFEFKLKGGNWVSGNKLKITGESGDKLGGVVIYNDRPYMIKDYTRGNMAITTYLIEQHKAINWLDAIKLLSSRVGLNLPLNDRSSEDIEACRAETHKAELFETANDFFINNLSGVSDPIATKDNDAKAHREYLTGRGYAKLLRLPQEELDLQSNKMELGFIPSQEVLTKHLQDKGLSLIDIKELQLHSSIGRENKLTIPYRDPLGRICGFGFRNINWTDSTKTPKYIYSTGLDRKTYMLNQRAIESDKDLIVVEGILDALYAKALGLGNVVTLGGTSINVAQIRTAVSYGAKTITLCLDNDRAGAEATVKAINEIKKSNEPIEVYIANLPKAFKDPDEFIRSKGIEEFKSIVRGARSWDLYLLGKRVTEASILKNKAGELDDKDIDLLIGDAVTIGSQIKDPIKSDRFRSEFIKGATSLGLNLTDTNITDAIDRLQYTKNKENQRDELAKTLTKAQDLLSSGREVEAQDLLSKQSKQLNTGSLETSYKTLTIPMSEEEFLLGIKNKPNSLNSGFSMGGEDLLLSTGAISIVAAPTSHGKTTFLINIALNLAQAENAKPVYLFSYEENREAIALKALNVYANRTLSKNNRRSIEAFLKNNDESFFGKEYALEVEEFKSDKSRFFSDLIGNGHLNIHYVDYTVDELVGAIRYLHKTDNVGAIVIDYMQLLSLKENNTNSRQEELKQICLMLKDCAVDTGLPIILAAQFNRTVTEIAKMHPTAISEAGDIERIANLIIGIWNKQFPELGLTSDRAPEIYATVLKGRDMGAGAEAIFKFDGNTGKISNDIQRDVFDTIVKTNKKGK